MTELKNKLLIETQILVAKKKELIIKERTSLIEKLESDGVKRMINTYKTYSNDKTKLSVAIEKRLTTLETTFNKINSFNINSIQFAGLIKNTEENEKNRLEAIQKGAMAKFYKDKTDINNFTTNDNLMLIDAQIKKEAELAEKSITTYDSDISKVDKKLEDISNYITSNQTNRINVENVKKLKDDFSNLMDKKIITLLSSSNNRIRNTQKAIAILKRNDNSTENTEQLDAKNISLIEARQGYVQALNVKKKYIQSINVKGNDKQNKIRIDETQKEIENQQKEIENQQTLISISP
jgi:hypothetical protein